jgi:hypothetical protein
MATVLAALLLLIFVAMQGAVVFATALLALRIVG